MLPHVAQQEDKKYEFKMLEQRKIVILLASMRVSPKSVQQLSSECKIPLSTTYRTIGEMARLDFVKTKYAFNESRKWEKIYRCNEFFIEDIKNKNVTNQQTNIEWS